MGYSLTAQNGRVVYGVKHYTIDKLADLKDVPARTAGCTAFCIENSKEYMMDTKGYWREVDLGGNGSGSGAGSQNVEVVYEGGVVTGGGS